MSVNQNSSNFSPKPGSLLSLLRIPLKVDKQKSNKNDIIPSTHRENKDISITNLRTSNSANNLDFQENKGSSFIRSSLQETNKNTPKDSKQLINNNNNNSFIVHKIRNSNLDSDTSYKTDKTGSNRMPAVCTNSIKESFGYGIYQYYLLNMHHVVRIQQFVRNIRHNQLKLKKAKDERLLLQKNRQFHQQLSIENLNLQSTQICANEEKALSEAVSFGQMTKFAGFEQISNQSSHSFDDHFSQIPVPAVDIIQRKVDLQGQITQSFDNRKTDKEINEQNQKEKQPAFRNDSFDVENIHSCFEDKQQGQQNREGYSNDQGISRMVRGSSSHITQNNGDSFTQTPSRTIESLQMENTKLKKIVFQMKLEMKSQLEQGLVSQRNKMKCINDEYLSFIEKIMCDKKELTRKCDALMQENNILLSQVTQPHQSSEIPNSNCNKSDSKMTNSTNNHIKGSSGNNDRIRSTNQKILHATSTQESTCISISVSAQGISTDMNSNEIGQLENLIEELEKQQEYIVHLHAIQDELQAKHDDLASKLAIAETQVVQSSVLSEQKIQFNQRNISSDKKQRLIASKESNLIELIQTLQTENDHLKKKLQFGVCNKCLIRQSEISPSSQAEDPIDWIKNGNSQDQVRIGGNSVAEKFKYHDREFDSFKFSEIETIIQSIDAERKQACEMVTRMKEAHEVMQAKHEEQLQVLREKHAYDFGQYEENLRITLLKKDQSIQKLTFVIENLRNQTNLSSFG